MKSPQPYVAFVHWVEMPWFDDVLAFARARAGLPVVVISDRKENKEGVRWHDIKQFHWDGFEKLAAVRGLFFAGSIRRWFVLNKAMQRGIVSAPVFTPDWDDLIQMPLASTAEHFAHADYATTFHATHIKRAPLLINNPACLDSFCRMIETMLAIESPRLRSIQDSSGWSVTALVHDWTVANLCEIFDNSVFDHSLGFGAEDGYVMDGAMKKLDWFSGVPYFYVAPGRGVRAKTIQCWGRFKEKIPEYRKLAGL